MEVMDKKCAVDSACLEELYKELFNVLEQSYQENTREGNQKYLESEVDKYDNENDAKNEVKKGKNTKLISSVLNHFTF